jgi:glutamine synthetase
LKGIEEEYPLPSPITGDVMSMSAEERTARGISRLPTSMGDAIALAEDSELLRKTLGDFVYETLIRNKKQEWEQYRSTVTDYEIARYLPLL